MIVTEPMKAAMRREVLDHLKALKNDSSRSEGARRAAVAVTHELLDLWEPPATAGVPASEPSAVDAAPLDETQQDHSTECAEKASTRGGA